ncbi:MAG: hypothetical protein HFI68_06615 [Lachnospiraceae bacterium]|nr:hypothetical protein [Lachnospiraceae bacterium]
MKFFKKNSGVSDTASFQLFQKKGNIKNSKKKVQEYETMFLSNVTIEDKRFGKCIFEKDANRNTLELIHGISEIPFGKCHTPEIHIHVGENDISQAFRDLAYVYDNQERFILEFCKGAKDFCDEWEETDPEGNPIGLGFLLETCEIFSITVGNTWDGQVTVSLSSCLTDAAGRDLLGCHSVIAQINCRTNEIEYGLEG